MAGGPVSGAVGKAEVDVGAPVMDVAWKDDGSALFGVGCGKAVKMWNLQTNQVQDIGSVRGVMGKDVPWGRRGRCGCIAQGGRYIWVGNIRSLH